uniref:Uncharacterized protein n=1 Tax=Chromera velia CCMP2878 TaxID=1169474 RepID=A0A0G4HJF0_9ALVE|eukprot:Cvel_28135.t1-p1 / transcript=Cvel_28135.t1 / gene=Cvel_28135 / organism=Chromera_velia_CCMP2878 / gene_product=hypothetical protein / transcript_product=hypothetical protein / location=Cvel_scaffold3631:2249-7598(+) / protein_length=992 / sequence_SO=supercontig / SO=protein_coding / is_pseudo=false
MSDPHVPSPSIGVTRDPDVESISSRAEGKDITSPPEEGPRVIRRDLYKRQSLAYSMGGQTGSSQIPACRPVPTISADGSELRAHTSTSDYSPSPLSLMRRVGERGGTGTGTGTENLMGGEASGELQAYIDMLEQKVIEAEQVIEKKSTEIEALKRSLGGETYRRKQEGRAVSIEMDTLEKENFALKAAYNGLLSENEKLRETSRRATRLDAMLSEAANELNALRTEKEELENKTKVLQNSSRGRRGLRDYKGDSELTEQSVEDDDTLQLSGQWSARGNMSDRSNKESLTARFRGTISGVVPMTSPRRPSDAGTGALSPAQLQRLRALELRVVGLEEANEQLELANKKLTTEKDEALTLLEERAWRQRAASASSGGRQTPVMAGPASPAPSRWRHSSVASVFSLAGNGGGGEGGDLEGEMIRSLQKEVEVMEDRNDILMAENQKLKEELDRLRTRTPPTCPVPNMPTGGHAESSSSKPPSTQTKGHPFSMAVPKLNLARLNTHSGAPSQPSQPTHTEKHKRGKEPRQEEKKERSVWAVHPYPFATNRKDGPPSQLRVPSISSEDNSDSSSAHSGTDDDSPSGRRKNAPTSAAPVFRRFHHAATSPAPATGGDFEDEDGGADQRPGLGCIALSVSQCESEVGGATSTKGSAVNSGAGHLGGRRGSRDEAEADKALVEEMAKVTKLRALISHAGSPQLIEMMEACGLSSLKDHSRLSHVPPELMKEETRDDQTPNAASSSSSSQQTLVQQTRAGGGGGSGTTQASASATLASANRLGLKGACLFLDAKDAEIDHLAAMLAEERRQKVKFHRRWQLLLADKDGTREREKEKGESEVRPPEKIQGSAKAARIISPRSGPPPSMVAESGHTPGNDTARASTPVDTSSRNPEVERTGERAAALIITATENPLSPGPFHFRDRTGNPSALSPQSQQTDGGQAMLSPTSGGVESYFDYQMQKTKPVAPDNFWSRLFGLRSAGDNKDKEKDKEDKSDPKGNT